MDLFGLIFSGEGAIPLLWEVATRCTCWDADTRQPDWNCTICGGFGTSYAPGNPDPQDATLNVAITGLFRGQSRWRSHRVSGEHGLGEAQVTLPLTHKPNYVDERVRDRFTVTIAVDDAAAGSIWYPAAVPVPFLFEGAQRAWRVQLQGMDQSTRVKPQP